MVVLRLTLLSACLLLMTRGGLLRAAAPGDREEFFETKIRPVLTQHCLKCHGAEKVSGELRIDSRDALLKGGSQGTSLVPGKPEESLLILALRHKEGELQMPPDKPLPPEVVKDFVRWVEQGAVWPKTSVIEAGAAAKHWAFVPVKGPAIPEDPTGWAETSLDRLIAARWKEAGVTPVEQADKRTLVRRLSFDLCGLPPTPEQIDTFLKDESPGAWSHLVEEMLASPRYGERWGRHWMDVVRYADTAGDNADYPIPEIHRYRDYIIDSFNRDKPFDQFVIEQLAGDILAVEGPPELYTERVVATGFVALSRRYATAPFELMHLTMEDSIDTVGRAFLGITMKCARCHDHKFDPVTMRDYYGLYGIFASTRYPYAGSEEFQSKNLPRTGFVPLDRSAEATARQKAQAEKVKAQETLLQELRSTGPAAKELARLVAELEQLNEQIARHGEDQPEQVAKLKSVLAETRKKRQGLEKKQTDEIKKQERVLRDLASRGMPDEVPVAYAVWEDKPQDVPVQQRGEPAMPGPVVPHSVPKAFVSGSSPVFPPNTSGRKQLAEWLVNRDNPLTARVFVNRVWQYHFGRGIAGTPSNFGLRGEAPTHPEVIDYLADKFMSQGWSVKQLHREILLSKTYRLSSRMAAAQQAKDPANQWYWRFPRKRLEAEAIRDSLLFVSGRLDLARPGVHPFPPIKEWNWTQHKPFKEVYPSQHRSVYLMTQRLQRHPFLGLFDAPDTNTTTEKRTSSTVPLQALYLMNNAEMKGDAEAFAVLIRKNGTTTAERMNWAYQRAFGRPATEDEIKRSGEFLDR
ncbi:MAG: DUF1553 domain-containing protein [Planctomycetales bacterium]